MTQFRQVAALALAMQMLACAGGAPDNGTGTTRTEPPDSGKGVQHLGDNSSAPPADRNVRNVVINDVRLSDAEIQEIEQRYRIQIVNANYWYDSVNGSWGIKGGPMRGIVLPGLRLGGPLQADASGTSHTGTFVNGRELHPLDVAGLNRCPGVHVELGRFWVTADGWAGREGAGPLFNLYTVCGGGGSGSRSGWLCDGGSCGTDRTVTGPNGVVSEGNGQAGVYTGSGLILTP